MLLDVRSALIIPPGLVYRVLLMRKILMIVSVGQGSIRTLFLKLFIVNVLLVLVMDLCFVILVYLITIS